MDTLPSHEALSGQLNSNFDVDSDEGGIQLELSEISQRKLTGNQEQFAITLRGPHEPNLGQGTLRLRHSQLGEFDLFVVPIRQDSANLYYEAVFNRFLDQ